MSDSVILFILGSARQTLVGMAAKLTYGWEGDHNKEGMYGI